MCVNHVRPDLGVNMCGAPIQCRDLQILHEIMGWPSPCYGVFGFTYHRSGANQEQALAAAHLKSCEIKATDTMKTFTSRSYHARMHVN